MTSRWIPFSLMMAVIGIVIVYQIVIIGQPAEPTYPISRTVRYSLTVKNPSNKPVRKASFWLYAPVKQSVYQVLDEVVSSHPYRMEESESGNQRMHFLIENLPPFGQKHYTITARLRLSAIPNTIPSIKQDDFLAEEALIEFSESRIQKLAHRLSGDMDKQSVKNIFQWVTANIEKTGFIARAQGALQTLVSKSGDCTDSMYLFAALSRANGIPTRNMAGFIARENTLLKPRDYHNWLEVFVDGEWRLIDPDKGVYMERAEEYIAMTILNDAPSIESQLSQHLFGGSENIEITVN